MNHSRILQSVMLALITCVLCATPALAEISFFGTAKVKPTYYSNFDFNDGANDSAIVNEGGLTKGEQIRAEFRLGWAASGDKWKVKMIAEADVMYEKDTADRSFYVNSDKEAQPNTGGEFGIERAELLYTFLPQLELETGWDIRSLDIKTGGLLYGDDHPFIGFRGQLAENTKYEALYIPIQNRVSLQTDPMESSDANDWRVYSVKLDQTFGGEDNSFTLSPLAALSDNDSRKAEIFYYGLEGTGSFGIVRPSFEVVFADGDFDASVGGNDISSMAAYAGVEFALNKAFNPYIAGRYTQGDDDANDNDVEGWVGITDIGRFTGLMGMDGNVLGEDLGQSYGATLYSYSPERFYNMNSAIAKQNLYGGISNGGSGDNPGQRLLAVGTKGDLSDLIANLSYKSQVFFIWYDETDNLINVKNPGKDVDDYAGTAFDLQVLYPLSKNFSVDYIFSTLLPGAGLKDQVDANDAAMVNMLTLAWTY